MMPARIYLDLAAARRGVADAAWLIRRGLTRRG
jgi:hypothetical protein